jgi:hypothetical protein
MNRFLIKTGIFLIISFLMLWAYGTFCEWFFVKTSYFPNDSRRYWAMKQKNIDADYVVLGSSRAEGAFDMQLLDSLTHQHGINLSSNGSGYVDNYLVLSKFLEHGNQVKLLYLQVDNYSLDPEGSFSNAFHVFNFLAYWHDPEFQKIIAHYLTPFQQRLFYALPWLRFYVYNKYFSPVEVIRRVKLKNKSGAIRMDQKLKASFLAPSTLPDSSRFFGGNGTRKFQVNAFDEMHLKKIIALARSKNIQVICFTAPDFFYQRKRFVNYGQTEQHLHQLLQQESVNHISDLFKIEDSKDLRYFKDPEHLNRFGVGVFTQKFAEQVNAIHQVSK